LFAFDLDTGALRWALSLGSQAPPFAQWNDIWPSAVSGVVYARTGGGGYTGEVLAFDEMTGAELWRKPIGTAYGAGTVTIGGDGTLFVSEGYFIRAFDSAGVEKWAVPTLTVGDCQFASVSSFGFMALAEGRLFVRSNSPCGLAQAYALSVDDGAVVWESEILPGPLASPNDSTPAIAYSRLFFGVGNTLYAYGP